MSITKSYRAASLDSLANSNTESLTTLSDDSDCEASPFEPLCRTWASNNNGSSKGCSDNNESSYEYVANDNKRMETIPEENEPKVSVKEILARFENLRGRREKQKMIIIDQQQHDLNNNNQECDKQLHHQQQQQQETPISNDIPESNYQHNHHHHQQQQMHIPPEVLDNFKSCSDEFNSNSVNNNSNSSSKQRSEDSKKQKHHKKDDDRKEMQSKSPVHQRVVMSSPQSQSSGATSGPAGGVAATGVSMMQERMELSSSQAAQGMENVHHQESSRTMQRNSMPANSSPQPPTGKYSLMQFALQNFRQSTELELLKMDSSLKSKEKRKEWTWKQQTDLIKWQQSPIEGPLLRHEDPELSMLATECFECILRYCGDLPLTPEMSEVKCVYTVLMHCHKHFPLRDEVYCQLMKQTTSNKSDSPESCQRAWRLLSIIAAYFACSDVLGPFLTEHLSSAASDRRRLCHGTAAVCLSNLRKTQRCGGRKNVPSVEEVTAVSAGRSARRQIYRLPGGAERVVNTRCSTVVADVINELCGLIGVAGEDEQQEFSLYCIVQGDAFTMPLAADEYILDVTTELHKAAQPFYLIFCRSVWYHSLKHDASPLYTEVLFNQVAPDYLEGLLLRLGNPNLPPSIVRDMALIAALLHRAADLNHSPNLKEVKFLLPKPVLGLREPRPPQWLALVQTSWAQAAPLTVSRAKHRVLQVLSNWQLFGSSFFAVKRVTGEVDGGGGGAGWQEHILALNRNGVHFLDMTTHEALQHWPFAEVISTRKVRSEDGALFLDMKCGNLLQQRVTRLQTEQAHEISRLVRQYITLEQASATRSPKQ